MFQTQMFHKGTTDEDNVEIRKWGEPTKFDFEPKAHWDLGTDLDILDFETAGKITGSRFTLYKGLGARLRKSYNKLLLKYSYRRTWIYRNFTTIYGK